MKRRTFMETTWETRQGGQQARSDLWTRLHPNCHRCQRTKQFLLIVILQQNLHWSYFDDQLPYVQLHDRDNWDCHLYPKNIMANRGANNQQCSFASLYCTQFTCPTEALLPYGLYCLIRLLPCSSACHINSWGHTGNRVCKTKGWRCSLNRDDSNSISGWASAAQKAIIKIIKRKVRT
jgi:hypothetical protein